MHVDYENVFDTSGMKTTNTKRHVSCWAECFSLWIVQMEQRSVKYSDREKKKTMKNKHTEEVINRKIMVS